MAIEVFPDSPTAGMSPRISFSHDLSQNDDDVPVEQYLRSPSSAAAVDFDFCIFRESFVQDDSSSADELFFDGKILPIEIKRRLPPPPPPPRPCYILPPPPPSQLQKTTPDPETEEKQSKVSSSSFWSFKRSTSLNCGNGYARTLCPLPLLSRSNSTGSTSSSIKRSNSNSNPHNQKQNLAKNTSPSSPLKQSSSSNHQKLPLKKNINGYYSNAVKINPVLNIPPANLFGLGSIFSGGKDRNKKK